MSGYSKIQPIFHHFIIRLNFFLNSDNYFTLFSQHFILIFVYLICFLNQYLIKFFSLFLLTRRFWPFFLLPLATFLIALLAAIS